MKTYEFTIIASGLDPEAADFADRFFNAGCDDATIALVKGAIILEFEREARNFSHALVSAMRDVVRAGATIEHIEPDYLVNLSDIAERLRVSKASVSLYAKGERASNFPAPVARVTTDGPLWDWVDVARWSYRRCTVSLETLVQAKIVRAANSAVSEKQERRGRSKSERRLARELEPA